MNELVLWLFLITLPVVAIGLHELTHLAAARLYTTVRIGGISLRPFTLTLQFTGREPPTHVLRVVALAPLLVGMSTGGLLYSTGIWRLLYAIEPYYLSYLIVLNWLLYSHLSPTDLRLAIKPDTAARSATGH